MFLLKNNPGMHGDEPMQNSREKYSFICNIIFVLSFRVFMHFLSLFSQKINFFFVLTVCELQLAIGDSLNLIN